MEISSSSLPSRPKPPVAVKTPRSKGCRVCVQRRIKCDQTRPFCKRCIRSNRQCPGFDQVKFVDEGPGLRSMYGDSEDEKSASSKSPSSSFTPSQAPPYMGSTIFEHPTPASTSERRSLSPSHDQNWQKGSFERTALVSLLAPTAHQDQLLANLINSIQQPFAAPIIRSHSLWLAEVARKPVHSTSLTWAIRAISISKLARKASDDALLETSRRLHGVALLKPNQALQSNEDGLSSDTLSSTLILSFYEVFNCTDRDSWIRHAGGAGRLIHLRGPDRHRRAWRKLCWDIHADLRLSSSLGDSYEEYFQELVDFPAYLANASELVRSAEAGTSDLEDLRTEGLAHRSEFRRIHTKMGEELAGAGLQPTKVASTHNDAMFPLVYHYPDMHIASLYCCYWAAMCAINITIIALETRMTGFIVSPPVPLEISPAPASNLVPSELYAPSPNGGAGLLWKAAKEGGKRTHGYIFENAANAREISKSAEYMANTPFMGPLYLLFGIRLALRMPLSREEKSWVLVRLREIGGSIGLARVEIERYETQRTTGYGVEWEQ
ncbi:hypothetical protein ACLMJK_006330 [Lecanora helva]